MQETGKGTTGSLWKIVAAQLIPPAAGHKLKISVARFKRSYTSEFFDDILNIWMLARNYILNDSVQTKTYLCAQ